MPILNRNQILQVDDLKKELINVPEWNGQIYIRTLTGSERDAFEQSIIADKGKTNLANIRARLCALAICDEKGKRLFEDKDIVTLGSKSAVALDCVFSAVQKLNGIGEEEIEELAKNSKNTQTDDSTSN